MTNFQAEYSALPTVSIVVPNQLNGMHSGNNSEMIQSGDRWLQTHLDAYVQWAQQHNSLLIVTWDEDNGKRITGSQRSSSDPWCRPVDTDNVLPNTISCARLRISMGFRTPAQAPMRHPSSKSGYPPLAPDEPSRAPYFQYCLVQSHERVQSGCIP